MSDSERGTGPPGTTHTLLPVSGTASSGPSGTPPPSRYPAPSSGTDPTHTRYPRGRGRCRPPPHRQRSPPGAVPHLLPSLVSPRQLLPCPSPALAAPEGPPSGPRCPGGGSAGCGVGDSLGDPRWGCPPCPGGQSRLQEHGQLLALPPQRGVTVARSGGFANWSQFPRHWVGGPVSGRCRRLAAGGLTFGRLAGGALCMWGVSRAALAPQTLGSEVSA